MFGYVVVNKPELKIKDFDRYREFYCGLCHALRERHGVAGQISLSYDAAFAAVILTALYEPHTIQLESRCVVHPIGKKKYLKNRIIDYVSDMNLVLTYYKCLDDWEDDRNYIRLGYSGIIRSEVKKIKQEYGEKVNLIRDRIRRLGRLEKEKNTNIDELAGTFGDIMGEILAVNPGKITGMRNEHTYNAEWEDELRGLGFYLGKFIYILDAFDDVEEDIEKGRFNPFATKYEKDSKIFNDWVKKLLMMVAAELAKYYEKLPIIDETAILRNIIYSGIWTRYFRICETKL